MSSHLKWSNQENFLTDVPSCLGFYFILDIIKLTTKSSHHKCFASVYVRVPHMCWYHWYQRRPKRMLECPETGVMDSCESPYSVEN